jgi:hypothetical protein
VIRQHAGSLPFELIGRRKKVGRSETGMVYEQSIRVHDPEGKPHTLRRVTVKLDQPTRDGDTEIHIVTNLPQRITALRVAELYRGRWTIETAFQEMAQNLEGEVETLGYPRAALFAFCMALVSYNVVSVILAALRAAHGSEAVEQGVSFYYLCDEVAGTYRGMTIAVPESYWTKHYAALSPLQLARKLVAIAKTINLSRYRKQKRGNREPPTKMKKKRRNHVSTARVLAQRHANAG